MKIPRNINGSDLERALPALGYERVRQVGSHFRHTTAVNGMHQVTVPSHRL